MGIDYQPCQDTSCPRPEIGFRRKEEGGGPIRIHDDEMPILVIDFSRHSELGRFQNHQVLIRESAFEDLSVITSRMIGII
jgi:hypothetical protein